VAILSWCQWLQDTRWATAIRESAWLFPVVEGSHILALSLSVGIIVLFDLRLLRLAFRGERASVIMAEVAPWMLAGFAVVFSTGLLLFAAQAAKAYVNPFFRVKMLLLVAAGLNAAVYQVKYFPSMAQWELAPAAPRGVRVIAALSLVFWVAVIALGRTMAYEL
jgi:hypothetical protein